jgi:FixJ family two-component response regulator
MNFSLFFGIQTLLLQWAKSDAGQPRRISRFIFVTVFCMTISSGTPIIYVVDDEASVRKALERLLRSVGHQVQTFASAEEFLASNYDPRDSCLVLDVQLEGMSGLELQQHLSKEEILIPIVFITAHADNGLQSKVEKAGSVLLKKPFVDHALLEAIQKVTAKI